MKNNLRKNIKEALKALNLTTVDFVVEFPNDIMHGDYATNVALVSAKSAKIQPLVLAEKIVEYLKGQCVTGAHKIEIAGPGFINFFVDPDILHEELLNAIKNPDLNKKNIDGYSRWGETKKTTQEEILIEYTSPNLFKPLHVGNLVGNIIGESIARLYEFGGYTVRRLNYPSDIGLTVAKGVWGIKKTGGDPQDISALGEAYRVGNDAYENGGEEKAEIDTINIALYNKSSEELNAIRETGIETSKRRLEEICNILGTSFDKEIRESEAGIVGTEIVKKNTGIIFEESGGAIIYRGEKFGLHTRVFLNSRGLPTYEAKELGNFALKQKAYPKWSSSLVVTGNEQTEYFKVVFSAIKEVFAEAKDRTLIHIPTGFLTLSTGKMSSRKGNVLTGESIIEDLRVAAREKAIDSRSNDVPTLAKQVAVAALKYQILKHGLGSDIVFDKEKSLSFDGDSGPYLQYTHARICSVLEKAKEVGIECGLAQTPEIPIELERLVYRFPEVVTEIRESHSPHTLVTYLTELAGSFNTFYSHEKIANKNDQYAPYKMLITDVTRLTLRNGLYLLGIEAPEKM